MKIRKILFGFLLLMCSITNACSQGSMLPTHIAQFDVNPSSYGDLVYLLDSALKGSGLTRYGAAPGLNALRGREVLFIEYRLKQSDKWVFITATDVVKVGTVQLRVYSTVLTDEQSRKEVISRLELVVGKFGARLRATRINNKAGLNP